MKNNWIDKQFFRCQSQHWIPSLLRFWFGIFLVICGKYLSFCKIEELLFQDTVHSKMQAWWQYLLTFNKGHLWLQFMTIPDCPGRSIKKVQMGLITCSIPPSSVSVSVMTSTIVTMCVIISVYCGKGPFVTISQSICQTRGSRFESTDKEPVFVILIADTERIILYCPKNSVILLNGYLKTIQCMLFYGH